MVKKLKPRIEIITKITVVFGNEKSWKTKYIFPKIRHI
jgi:hypothetical protein